MSDPVIRRVRRAIEEAANRGGMTAGMPKVTIDASDATRLCLLAERLLTEESLHQQPEQGDDDGGEYAAYLEGMNSHLKAESEALRERLENYEALKRMHRLDNYPNELSAKAWLLRKQAEAVEPAIRTALRNLGNADISEDDIARFASGYAARIRQQANEQEQSQ